MQKKLSLKKAEEEQQQPQNARKIEELEERSNSKSIRLRNDNRKK